jgi:hypothetical protein
MHMRQPPRIWLGEQSRVLLGRLRTRYADSEQVLEMRSLKWSRLTFVTKVLGQQPDRRLCADPRYKKAWL